MPREKRVLVVVPRLVAPDMSSGDRRLFAILVRLASRCHVDLALSHRPESRYHGLLQARVPHYKRMLAELGIDVWADGWSPWRQALATHRYVGVLAEFFYVAHLLLPEVRRSQLHCPLVVDSVDLHYIRQRRAVTYGDVGLAEAERTQYLELAVYRAVDAVVVVTTEEDEILRHHDIMTERFVIPNIVPLRARPAMLRDPEVLFVGAFDHCPNVDGVLWFVNEIWNMVRDRVPMARLRIVGSNPPPAVLELDSRPGVDVTGYVPDTGPYLDQAAVSIAPLRYGAGMKGKVTEALAAGVPVVTTSIGAEGFSAVNGEHLLVANSAGDFAAAVVKTLQDPGRAARLGEAGQALVAGICGLDAVVVPIDKMIDFLLDRPIPAASCGWLSYWCEYRAKAVAEGIVRSSSKLEGRQLVKRLRYRQL